MRGRIRCREKVEGKAFFSEEKKQKTFVSLSWDYQEGRRQPIRTKQELDRDDTEGTKVSRRKKNPAGPHYFLLRVLCVLAVKFFLTSSVTAQTGREMKQGILLLSRLTPAAYGQGSNVSWFF
jgi:hypothetical protein